MELAGVWAWAMGNGHGDGKGSESGISARNRRETSRESLAFLLLFFLALLGENKLSYFGHTCLFFPGSYNRREGDKLPLTSRIDAFLEFIITCDFPLPSFFFWLVLLFLLSR